MERLRFLKTKVKRGLLCLLLPLYRLSCNKESTYAVRSHPWGADGVQAPDLTTGSATAGLGGSALLSAETPRVAELTLFLIFLRIFFRAFSSDFVRGSLVGMG